MNPLGYLDSLGILFPITSKELCTYVSQGYSYLMPYYGDAVMVYDFTAKAVVIPQVVGTGCLLSILSIFRI
jgi:hypothetical protein